MNIIFRVDSSSQMGLGHLMRCLTLANEFKKQGHRVTFLCRELVGNFISLIQHPVLILPRENNFQSDDLYLSWLGTTQKKDAEQVIKLIPKNADALIVDSYALNEVWHTQLKLHVKKIVVIDDLADKKFDCDILLNQNFGAKEKYYKQKLLKDCKLLLGCEYSLLRPEFARLRAQAIEKRKNTKEVKNILISVGGSDKNNVTYKILQQLGNEFNVVVVLGSASPYNQMVKNYSEGKNIRVIINAKNMGMLMLEADLAIGASGSTNWERISLGLPSFIFTVAENQIKYAKILDKSGLVKLLGDVHENGVFDKLKNNILAVINLNTWSERCFNSCSCDGVLKVIKIIIREVELGK
jgi:UDP-2,4-diacetamido-2,4,6-trideoxy-beta-L-altropyranose hydrolase